MITGMVNASREARIPLRLLGSNGAVQDLEAVIDTGFDGFLTLPSAVIAALNCPHIGRGSATLANGQSEPFDIHETTVIWVGQPRTIEADAAETEELVGMGLIDGYELRIQARNGGRVTIEALP